VIPFIYQAI
jgi:hypothetical protein